MGLAAKTAVCHMRGRPWRGTLTVELGCPGGGYWPRSPLSMSMVSGGASSPVSTGAATPVRKALT